jgi:mono/diheme cytochrome c family protein
MAKYTKFCSACHSAGLKLGTATPTSGMVVKALSIGRIAQKVRTSGPPPSGMADASDTTPGPMPFFEPDELSVQDLKDIIAYIKQ